MSQPKQLIDPYRTYKLGAIIDYSKAITEYWLCNMNGNSFYLKWWGSGWVIQCQQSYLCKDKTFKHSADIPGFEFSHLPTIQAISIKGKGDWQHVFDTKEGAVDCFITRDTPVRKSEAFYNKVYDIMVAIAHADTGYRDAFIYNYVEDKFTSNEWRIQGTLGFGGKYRGDTNTVDCYAEDETPQRIETMKLINFELKKLDDENAE